MPIIACIICETQFYAKPSHITRGWGKYCSKKCQYESQKNGLIYPCFECNKPVYRTPKSVLVSKSGKFFCDKSCQTIWRNSNLYSGKQHANWNGGKASYRSILIKSGVNRICKKCNTTDTRVLAVHHKDKNRNNNDISNLLWLCNNCHYLVHHYEDESHGFIVLLSQ